MERNCKKCIHHIGGSCDAWECNMQTLEDYRNKVIDKFMDEIATYYEKYGVEPNYHWLKELAEQMKVGDE